MLSLKEALLIHLRHKRLVDWENDSSDYIAQVVAYNAALQDTMNFLISYVDGDVNQEYLESLDQRQRGE